MDLVREEHLHKTHLSLLAEMIPLWVILGWHLRHDLLCSQEALYSINTLVVSLLR